jgi:hypothetical protein
MPHDGEYSALSIHQPKKYTKQYDKLLNNLVIKPKALTMTKCS